MAQFTLFSRYPFLSNSVPRIELGHWPTPLEAQTGLAGPAFLIKRDDLSHPLYGGNKVRKLELIFADALRRGCKEIITAGGLGSHHVLAVSALGRTINLSTTGLFFCQPVNDHVRQNLLLEHRYGTRMHFVRDYRGVAAAYLKYCLAVSLTTGRRPYLLMPGGSSAFSTLGYLNAALELQAQLHELGRPDPEAIFVAAGTGGTAAGLLAGIALAGMDTVLHAVRVVHPAVLKRSRITGLARRTLQLLARRGVETGSAMRGLDRRLHFEEDYLGEGYGFGTDQCAEALRLFREQGGVNLEGCYTGKAAAAALDYCSRRDPGSARPIVFVHTASSTHLHPGITLPAPAELPPDFQWCFSGNACRRRCGLRKRNLTFCKAAETETGTSSERHPFCCPQGFYRLPVELIIQDR
ncbi:MAG: pyridoxal-phosphate dependent enzyme [Bacillota bacterium]